MTGMEQRQIYITEFDVRRLQDFIMEAKRMSRRGDQYLEGLEAELLRAKKVAPEAVPPDVVTMNSKVRLLDVEMNEEMILTLVFPRDADIGESKISVLAPIGTAMLGYRAGDVFYWRVPDGVRSFRIEEILYQPEAAGDYNL
jgi:regulator of nucleoside diphosphate kinase